MNQRRLCSALLLLLCAGCGSASAERNSGEHTGGAQNIAGATASGGGSMLDPAVAPATKPLVRRLTRDEIENSVADLLGIVPSPAELDLIPRDRPLEGFVNTATSQTASPEHVAGYAAFARAIAKRLDGAAIAAHSTCQMPASECQASLVSSLTRLLFRRPADTDELTAFSALLQQALDAGASFDEGARTLLEGLLQAPQFLYRLERETAAATGVAPGRARVVTGYEMASRLSYLVWESAPDATLLAAAEAGRLDSAAGVASELARLLADSGRTQRATARFLKDWARLESLPSSELQPELVGSLLAFYQDYVWTKQGSLFQSFTARHAWLTPTLALNFGLASAGEGVREYDLTGTPERLGLLTQPGMIAGMTNADGGTIVARGLFLQTQLLCGETPSPPTSLQEAIDAFVAEQPENASHRQIAEVRLMRPECGGCHGMFDPLAYAFEKFDFQGRYREQDEHGNPVVSDGWIPARFTETGEPQPYAGIEQYMQLLTESKAVGACLVKQHLQYALGRRLDAEQDPLAAELHAAVAAQGGTYPALLSAIIQHAVFRELTVE